jgi:hypothetical protein
VYYVEFLEPREGVSIMDFRRVVRDHASRWAAEHREDELVMNVGKTWWLGDEPSYMTVWKISGAAVLDQWQSEFESGPAGAHHEEFSRVARIVRAGLYADIGEEIS